VNSDIKPIKKCLKKSSQFYQHFIIKIYNMFSNTLKASDMRKKNKQLIFCHNKKLFESIK